MSKLKTAFWFIRNPKYFPQIFQVLKRKKNKAKENSRRASLNWCKENLKSQDEVLKELFDNQTFLPFHKTHQHDFYQAKEKQNACPVEMGGEGATSFLYHIVKNGACKNIIETGVAYGWSSLVILMAIKENGTGKLISNDMPYIKMNNEDYVGTIVPDSLKKNWDLQRAPDIKGIPKALKKFNNKIDLCHYDSDKSYTGRMFAYPLLWEALEPGGFFISDDIQDNVAFKEFAESKQEKVYVIEHQSKYVGIIRKK